MNKLDGILASMRDEMKELTDFEFDQFWYEVDEVCIQEKERRVAATSE